MPAPKRRKQRVAIALEQQKRLAAEIEEAKKARAIELIKQNQMKAQEAVAKAEAIKPTQKKTKTKRAKAAPKKRRTK